MQGGKLKVLVLLGLLTVVVFSDDAVLYKKLAKEVVKKDIQFHKNGNTKVLVKNPKDTNLTKKIKNLLKKDKIAKTTKKYEKILKD